VGILSVNQVLLGLASLHANGDLSPPHQILFAGNGEDVGWISFLHGNYVKNGDDNYDVINFLGMMTHRELRFRTNDIKAKMMLPPWNNFL